MIRRVLDAPPLQVDVPEDLTAVLSTEVFILLYLVAEFHFDRGGLEQFIDETTAYTEMWLDARRGEPADTPVGSRDDGCLALINAQQ